MAEVIRDIRIMLSNSDGVFKEVVLRSVGLLLESDRFVNLYSLIKSFGSEIGLDLKDDANSTITESHAEDQSGHEYMVSYMSQTRGLFIYCGILQNLKVAQLDVDDLGEEICIKFRIRYISNVDEEALNKKSLNERKNVKCRTKERRIGDVVKKVIQWRTLYNDGDAHSPHCQWSDCMFICQCSENSEREGKKYSLEDAAQAVGMSKKSLDDYMLQIRCARKFAFNFNEHKDDKIGILRAFNKKYKMFLEKGKPGRKPKKSKLKLAARTF
jgi:hypothetical protein